MEFFQQIRACAEPWLVTSVFPSFLSNQNRSQCTNWYHDLNLKSKVEHQKTGITMNNVNMIFFVFIFWLRCAIKLLSYKISGFLPIKMAALQFAVLFWVYNAARLWLQLINLSKAQYENWAAICVLFTKVCFLNLSDWLCCLGHNMWAVMLPEAGNAADERHLSGLPVCLLISKLHCEMCAQMDSAM